MCGHEGEIKEDCPKCNAQSSYIDRIARITGYLVGTIDRWNPAKQSELKDREKHC